jgi:hypothetical protein
MAVLSGNMSCRAAFRFASDQSLMPCSAMSRAAALRDANSILQGAAQIGATSGAGIGQFAPASRSAMISGCAVASHQKS